MKKILLVLLLSTLSLATSATELSSWALGINYGTVSNWTRSFGLDLQLPSFYDGRTTSVAAVIDLDARDSLIFDTAYLVSANIIFRNHLYKDLVSSYAKIGVGYAFVDERLHNDEGFLFIPFTFGADILTYESNGTYSSFYAETGFNLDFLDRKYLKIHDGIFVNLGLRTYF